MQSPSFSSFRHLMDKWDTCLAEKAEHDSIGNMLDGRGMILFFKRGDDVFGAPEESRLVFAKMKSDDDDMPPTWKDEAHFLAANLMQALLGQHTDNMFGIKDLDNIKLIDRDSAVRELSAKAKKARDKKSKGEKKEKKTK